MHFFRMALFSILSVVFLLVGCSSYQPRPLNTTDLNNALSGFNKKRVAQQANLLNHPRISPIAIDFSKPLTTQELAVLAVLVSPDLKALRAKEGVAKAQVFDAGLLPDPKLIFTYAKTLQNISGLVNAYNYDLFWDVASLVTTRTQLKIVKAQSLQTHYEIAWQEWLTANQAQLLATRIYYLRQQLKVAKDTTRAAKKILTITKGNLLKHNTTIDQFGLRQSTYLDFIHQTTTINRALQKAILQLNQLMGIPPDKTIAINHQPMNFIPLNMHQLFAEAEVYRLDLLALQAGYLSQEATLYKAILGQFPHFTLDISKGRDNTNVHSMGPAIGFDIPLINRNRGAIAIAKATRQQLYLEYIARLNQTRSNIAILVTELTIINKEENILRNQLPELKKAEQLMREGVNKGNVTLITYESVLTSLLTNQLRLLTLEQSTAEQMIGLQIATGKYYAS